VGQAKGLIFLNSKREFGAPDNFTVMLDQGDAESYKDQGVELIPRGFVGKTVRVTGTIKLYQGKPEIKVTSAKRLIVKP
jgi:DNA/RNA endonuclease YhcR with UshA esterase domain